jgi:hypothetical protein
MKKLKLNKEIISNLDAVKGGAVNKGGGFTNDGLNHTGRGTWWSCDQCTNGCTDGCGPLKSMWNCTKADCTNDCAKPEKWAPR